MAKPKTIIGITVTHQHSSQGFSHDRLVVTLRPLRWHDYMKEMQGWLHNESIHNSLREKALACKRATEQTSVLMHKDSYSSNDIEVAWLGYRYKPEEEGTWIAPRIDGCYFDEASLEVLKKVTGTMSALGREPKPQDFINGLLDIGGLLVYWHKEADGWLPNASYDIDTLCSAETVRA